MIIRLFVLFTVLNLLFSIRGFAQQEKSRSHDVDSLLLTVVYETESGEDSLVYVKRDGSRLGATLMLPPAKCSRDSILMYQTACFELVTNEWDKRYLVYYAVLFENFEISEVRFMYDYGMKRYLGVIEDIIRGMKDVWKLPAWNKDTPILTMLPFYCVSWMNIRIRFPADFFENLVKLDTDRQWFHPAVYELYEGN